MIGSQHTGQSEQFSTSTKGAPSKAGHDSEPPGALSVAIRRELAGFILDITFNVPHGLTVLFGPSGAGKSLTLQAIAGLFSLDSANIALDGIIWQDSTNGFYLPPQRRHVGYVPQNYALFPHLTVEQNIVFGLKVRGRQRGQDNQRVSELIELMQLGGLEHRRPAQLSGGQQQRVALARALAPDPLLLLLDEPFSSLDAAVRETLREEMRALHERIHVPIVLVTHDAAEARALADTVVVVQRGCVLQVSTPDEVFRSPQTRTIAALVGMHTCWSGSVSAIAPLLQMPHTPASQQALTIQTYGISLHACIPAAMLAHTGQMLELGIRTDEIRVFSGKQSVESINEQTQPMALIPGTVIRDQPKGAFHSITVQLETGQRLDLPMIVREIHDAGIGVGSLVTVGIPASAVHVFKG